MPTDLSNAVIYDIETICNAFTLTACPLDKTNDNMLTFVIAEWRNDIRMLIEWFEALHTNRIPMIGYNNLAFDYPVIHDIWMMPGNVTAQTIYAKAQSIIGSQDANRFSSMIWQSDRFAPQIDLLKVHHFDNKAKTQSLKGLEFNMRSQLVQDMPVDHATYTTEQITNDVIIPYNAHDVLETKRFAQISMGMLNFRVKLESTLNGDVMNFSESKIGKQTVIQRLGYNVCFTLQNGRKVPRQTYRSRIALSECIFPYIQFKQLEFQRILDWMKGQVLTAAQITDELNQSEKVETKGVFKNVNATINGFTFHYGTGGIHGSVTARKFVADDEWIIEDIDVTSLYPSIAIVNRVAPEHLGDIFVDKYSELKAERAQYAKGTPENGAIKLGLNSVYGDSNNAYSPFLDPKYTMTITLNGQLLLSLLAEMLMTVPTLEIIQINTDGITYRIHQSMRSHARELQSQWEKFTLLDLERAQYSRVWIRDVNNYIAETAGSNKLKTKGAYWFPVNFPDDITNAIPSAWFRDLGGRVIPMAAQAAMVHGIPVRQYINWHAEPFDFMLRAKSTKGTKLYIGNTPQQRVTRYYIAKVGAGMRKVSPPVEGAEYGDWKRKNGLSDYEYQSIRKTLEPGTWDTRIHTGNKSKYADRTIGINDGYLVAECNNMANFNMDNVNFDWYVKEAEKLIIA